jgi:UDP-glucuronate decarboxylase
MGNPVERNMLELAEYINKTTGNSAGIVHKPLPKDDPTRRRPNIDRAKAELGWSPQVEFEDGMARTIAYFKAVL